MKIIRTDALEENFCSTPYQAALHMCNRVKSNMGELAALKILEPSAGEGHIIKVLLELGAKAENITAVEIHPERCEKLRELGVNVVQGDYTTVHEWMEWRENSFDAVLMTPPFSRRGIDHVIKAVCRDLRKGGYLAAVMPDSTFLRDDAKAASFRSFLNIIGTYWTERLPDGTFPVKTRVLYFMLNERLLVG